MNHQAIYERFRDSTMIPQQNYVSTLALAERCQNVQGCVVECGVWRGGLAAGLVSVLGADREYFLYDSFEGLPRARTIDGGNALQWQSRADCDNCYAPPEFAEQSMQLSGAQRYHLVQGWFTETLVHEKPKTPIAFLHLDADWYDSTLLCFEQLFDMVQVGGLIVVDDYHVWDGCSRAVHDFLGRRFSTQRILSMDGGRDYDLCYIVKRAET